MGPQAVVAGVAHAVGVQVPLSRIMVEWAVVRAIGRPVVITVAIERIRSVGINLRAVAEVLAYVYRLRKEKV